MHVKICANSDSNTGRQQPVAFAHRQHVPMAHRTPHGKTDMVGSLQQGDIG